MIPFVQRTVAVFFSVGLIVTVLQLIRTHKLREQYAIAWLVVSAIIFVLSVFGTLVDWLSAMFQVSYAPTLILVIGLLFALVVLLNHTVILSGQADQIRDLAQSMSILQWELQQKDHSPED